MVRKTLKKIITSLCIVTTACSVLAMVPIKASAGDLRVGNHIAEAPSTSVNATSLDTKDPLKTITNEDRDTAYILLIQHMNGLKALYDLNSDTVKRLDAVMYQANVYIANTNMTVGELSSYVNKVEGDMDAALGGATVVSETSSFLFLINPTPTNTISYGSSAPVTLTFANFGKEGVTDVVVTPKVSTKGAEWPFVITNASDVQLIKSIPKASSLEEATTLGQSLTWNFTVSDKAYTGTYPLTFHVQYYRNGGKEETDLTTYVNIKGKAGNGTLEDNSSDSDKTKPSTPRIIVTGFVTEPEQVHAGDTFALTITVQNTAQTTVSNIQFDLKAAQESLDADSKTTYEAFLPTSGSATIYVSSIAPGASTELNIEMTARNDLTQKPYVITIDAAYEDPDKNPFTASTNVSIPVYQEAKVDTGDAEVMPAAIGLYEQSNITFDIFNKGKTNLNNVSITFEDGYVTGGNTFLGKIEPGGTGSVDCTVEGAMTNEDSNIVTATISYEDEAGNITTIEKEINLSVYEMDYSEEDFGDDFYMEEDTKPKKKGMPIWLIGAIVGGVAGAVVAIIKLVKAKKAKKLRMLRELERDDEDNL